MRPTVAVLGAGIGGVAAAVKLRQAGINGFTVFEKSDGPGGTWRDNRYPGAACDVPSHLYSFSFRPKADWSRTHATQPEILQYVEDTVDEFGLRPHCRFGTAVTEAVWDETARQWRLRTDDGEQLSFDVVVSALGLLNVPRLPDLPGLADFAGPVVHTARWDPGQDPAGRRVAVIGTGSTAAQVVPQLAEQAASLYVFQREPGWVLPKRDREFSPAEVERFRRSSLARRRERAKAYLQGELATSYLVPGSTMSQRLTRLALRHLEKAVEDPDVRAALTPSYPFGCKRPVVDSRFLRAFNRPNVHLVPHAATRVTTGGVVAGDGVEREVDVIVLATGFQPTRFLSTLDVVGTGGRRLHDVWDDAQGPEAFLGLSVPGFPNFFMLYGPNTNSATTSLVFVLECQAAYVARAVRRIARGAGTVTEVRPAATGSYNRWLQRRIRRTAWVAGCGNYYRTASGKLVTNWPHTATLYWLLTRTLGTSPVLYRWSAS